MSVDDHRDPGDETDAELERLHAVRGADDPACTCGGGHTVHEANAGGHSTSCPLWGQTWEGWAG